MRILLAIVLVAVAGCGASPSQVVSPQTACFETSGRPLTAAEIDALRTLMEASRDLGTSFEVELEAWRQNCASGPSPADCFTCASAILNEVYGR